MADLLMDASRTVWLEVALNGPWTRERQPGIPVTVDELIADGIACARAGVSIVHVHAYDPTTGLQDDNPETYARVIEGIRAVEDVIVYPTLPMAFEAAGVRDDPGKRYHAVRWLAERGLLEWASIDPGSTHLTLLADAAAGRDGLLYLNPEDHVRYGLTLAGEHKFVPTYAIYEPGFVRLGAAMAKASPLCPAPLFRFMFTTQFTFGFPPETFALDSYISLLEREAPGSQWMVAGLGVDVSPLIPHTITAGGHVRVGLEDAPLGSAVTNVALVEDAARAIERAGGTLGAAPDIRMALNQGSGGSGLAPGLGASWPATVS